MNPTGTPQSTNSAPPACEVRDYAIADICLDERFRLRAVDPGTVARYASSLRNGATLPPAILGNIGGALYLLGGWHRLAAHVEADRSHLPAYVVDTTPEEAAWIAAADNLKHGLPITRKSDRLRVFKAYMRARQNRAGRRLKSYREIASELHGFSKTTIERYMKRLYPRIAQQMGGGDPLQRLREPESEPPDQSNHDAASSLIQQARAASRGVTSGPLREALVKQMQDALEELGGTPRAPRSLCVPDWPDDF